MNNLRIHDVSWSKDGAQTNSLWNYIMVENQIYALHKFVVGHFP